MAVLRDIVVVADDDKVVVALVTELLRQKGFNVFQAFDAMQAMLGARQQNPKAVVLDITMPGGSGIDVLKKIRGMNSNSQIPVIILTGSNDPKIEKEVRDLGANEFLRKPVDPGVLDAALRRVLGLTADAGPGSIHHIVTVVEGRVPEERSGVFQAAYATLLTMPIPNGLITTQLLRDMGDSEAWRIETVWRDRESIDAMRAQGTPLAVKLFRDAGVEPSVSLFERVASK
jgi:DNA-binding response OmpR family regulator